MADIITKDSEEFKELAGWIKRTGKSIEAATAVSYTHLDVYKRQTLDGYLVDKAVSSPLWDNPDKYGITKIRSRATQILDADVSFILLTKWKKEYLSLINI